MRKSKKSKKPKKKKRKWRIRQSLVPLVWQMFFKGSKTRRRKNKKRLRLVAVVPIYLYLRLRLKLVRPQGQALGDVGVDVLDGHVDVGVVVHPKPFFHPAKPCFVCFFRS